MHIIPAPKRKADYRGKQVRLLHTPPMEGVLPGASQIRQDCLKNNIRLYIDMRRSAADTAHINHLPDVSAWGDIRVLQLRYICPRCKASHVVIVPEHWIEEGWLEFVEEVDNDD